MLEILVTLFLLTMWLLASAGVQSSSLQFTKAAQFRTQAVYLATELAERMQANTTSAVRGTYALPIGTAPADCTTATCLPDDLAAFDLAEWDGRVTAALPNASVSVTNPGGVANPITYTILISWTDRRTYDSSLTATNESFSYTATKTIFDSSSL